MFCVMLMLWSLLNKKQFVMQRHTLFRFLDWSDTVLHLHLCSIDTLFVNKSHRANNQSKSCIITALKETIKIYQVPAVCKDT